MRIRLRSYLARMLRLAQRLTARACRCSCVRVMTCSWVEIEYGTTALFFPLSGYSCERRCPTCKGTGIPNLKVRAFCWNAWPGKQDRFA